MDAKTFVSVWESVRRPLIQYDKDMLINCSMPLDLVKDLSEVGLPSSAPPTLSFEKSSEINLSEKFKLPKKYSSFCYFGFTGVGDFICFDIEKKVFVIVRHEDRMDVTILNSSLPALYECLQSYTCFIKEVQEIGGSFAYIDGNISKSQIENLYDKLRSIDKAVTLPNSFWAQELEALRKRCNC